MRQVWKYNLGGTGQHDLSLPKRASILNFQIQGGVFTLWALVDITLDPSQWGEDDYEVRQFEIIGTGWDTKRRSFEYIGTVQDKAFVWHMFEVTIENDRTGWDDG